jgi:predicted deacylase
MVMKRIPVLSLASGDRLTVAAYDFKGSKKGAPSAYFQSAVHGSEVQGSLVIALLVDYFKKHPPLGNIRLVPNANPMGLNNKRGEYTDGRFDPVRGDNWNRRYVLPSRDLDWDSFLRKHRDSSDKALHAAFRLELRTALDKKAKALTGAAERMAVNLQRLSIDFDFCLDLHCANNSVRHCYVPDYAREDAAYLGIPFHLLMPNDKFGGAMDEVFFAPWAELARRRGKGIPPVQSFTVELGNHEEVSLAEAKKDAEGLLNYLRHMGVVAGKSVKGKPTRCELKHYTLVSAPVGGIVEYVAPVGKRVKKGALLARILRFGKSPEFTELTSPVSGIPILRHSSAVAHEGAELYKLMAVR